MDQQAGDIKSDPSKKRDRDKRKTIPHAEWIKMTLEQQDVIKAQNRSTKATRQDTLSPKNAFTELKKENAKTRPQFQPQRK